MTRGGDDETPPTNDGKPSAPHGETAFAAVGYVINVAKVTVVVIGLMLVVIALSGADLARLDEHEIFRRPCKIQTRISLDSKETRSGIELSTAVGDDWDGCPLRHRVISEKSAKSPFRPRRSSARINHRML